jgi:hypothetical protein
MLPRELSVDPGRPARSLCEPGIRLETRRARAQKRIATAVQYTGIATINEAKLTYVLMIATARGFVHGRLQIKNETYDKHVQC